MEEIELKYSQLLLFDQKNNYLKKYWQEGDITVILYYVNGGGQGGEIVFEFMLWKGKEVA